MKNISLFSISILLSILLFITTGNSAGHKKVDENKNAVQAVHQVLQDGKYKVESVQHSPSSVRKQAPVKVDQRQLEQGRKRLKKISEEHTIMQRIRQTLNKVERERTLRSALEAQQSKRVKLFGKQTRFIQAPSIMKSKTVNRVDQLLVSNVQINGKSQDTVYVGDPFTLTFSFAPNSMSAVMNVYIDADSNGVVSNGDISLDMNALMLDNDDNDADPAIGTYKVSSEDGDIFSNIVTSLIIEIDDYQSASSAMLTIRQKPTSSIVFGTVNPPVPNILCIAFGLPDALPDALIFLTDSAGMFSFYVDRQQTSEVNFFIYDYIGVANGYLTPQEKTISIISDTTRVDIALTPATSFIEGYVKDQMGVPIKNAKITASYSFLVRTKTDSIGYYKLGVQEGTWYCNANISWTTEYLRTNSISADINVPANATVRHDFMFIKSNNTISGRVTFDANGVGGVPIYVSTDSLSNSVLSSTDGNYSIPVYMPTVGTELYTVSADVGNGYFIDNSVRMNIMPGTTNVNFVITKVTGGLQGRITDIATGQPIPRAYIHASGSVNSKSVLSNDSGYYRISLLDGIYSLEVEAEPYFTYSESDIIISGSMVTKNIALHRSGSFSGKVIDIDGKPLQSVDVVALDSSGSSVGYGYSDEQGNYVVSGLGTSQYRAYSSKNGYVAQWYDNVSVLDSATFFQVTEGYDTPNINFVISRGGSISGKVVDKSGIPIIDVEIDVLDTLFNYQSYATTNDSGNYTISGLLTGNYYVRTYSSQYYDQWYDGASNSSDAKQVSVVINQNTPDINFILSAGASISGAVNDKNNVGIPYASISLLDSTLYIVAYYSTNRSGYYSIGKLVPAKTYYAYASASGYADRWYDNVSTPDSATAIVLQPEEKREHIDFILHKAGSISGRVFDEAGNPISYANVYSQDRSGNYIGYGYSDYMGNYTITNLNNGIYYIEASSYGYIDQWYDHKATIEQADQVTVVEDQETPNINFNLKRFTEDSIIVKIELANIPDTLLFSQDYVQDYNNDYWWGMRFNVDGDNSTGPNGCEIEIALTHYKSPGETAYKSDIINGTSHALIEWIGNNGYWQHSDVSAWIDPSNKNTLVMSVPKSWPEIQNIGTNTKYYVYSFYYSNSGVFSDVTRMGQGMVSITDPVGDVGFNFVDIIAANWSIKVPTSVQNVDVLPTVFKLDQNYPNPFNPSTIIAFDLPHSSLVSLKVYNILGQEVAMLVNEIKSAGHYATVWDAAGIPSGTYFYRLTYDNQIVTRKMLLLR